jgi:hypothetical protein
MDLIQEMCRAEKQRIIQEENRVPFKKEFNRGRSNSIHRFDDDK